MTTASDIISIYGAGLATVVAIIQYRQWRKSFDTLLVASNTYHGAKSDFEVVITNANQHLIIIGFVGAGVFYRPWLMPWCVRHSNIVSMYMIEKGMLTSKGAYGTLLPGQTMACHLPSNEFDEMRLPPFSGFRRRLCIDIEHSAASKSLVKLLGRA